MAFGNGDIASVYSSSFGVLTGGLFDGPEEWMAWTATAVPGQRGIQAQDPNPPMPMESPINVSDADTATESVTVQIGITVNVHDDVNETESVTVQIPASPPILESVSDDVSETDAVTVRISVNVVVADTETTTELVTVKIPMTIVVSEVGTPAESVTLYNDALDHWLFINGQFAGLELAATGTLPDSAWRAGVPTVDLIPSTVINALDVDLPTENVLVAISMAAAAIDAVPVNESTTVRVSMAVVVSDTDTETDAATVQIPMRVVVSDDEVATESVTVQIPMRIVVSDADTATETIQLLLSLTVYDDVGETESVTIQFPGVGSGIAIAVHDDDAPTEVVAFAFELRCLYVDVVDDNTFPPLDPPPMPMTGIARDYVDVEEGLAMGLALPVLAVDDVLETDAVTVRVPLSVVSVDSLTTVDAIATDAITINPVLVGFDNIVSDTVGPTDAVTVVRVLAVVVSDSEGVTEFAGAALPMAATVIDTDLPTEAVNVQSVLQVLVLDDQPITEGFNALVSVLLPDVSDPLDPEDVVFSAIPMAIQVHDVPEGGEDPVSERRFVKMSGFLDDLHLINDRSVENAETDEAIVRKY